MKNMRKLLTIGLAAFLALGSTTLSAQEKTNHEALNRMAKSMADYERVNFSKAIALANEKGLPLTRRDEAGNFAILVGIDPAGIPMYLSTENNITSAISTGTNQLWTGGSLGLNLSGSDNSVKGRLAIWDGGRLRNTHQEFVGRIFQRDEPSGLENHANHVAGTMIAAGVNPLAKGMAFGAQELQAYDFNNHLSELASAASTYNLLISNHSYGQIAGWSFNSGQNRWEYYGEAGSSEDFKFGFYSNEARWWDSISYAAPYYLIVKSAGNNRSQNGPADGSSYFQIAGGQTLTRTAGAISSNNGYDIISTYGNAKNILTVGAVAPLPSGYFGPSDVRITNFSSWGPSDDGRIKPDLVGVGADVLSVYGEASDNQYGTLSGTSMSSPNVSGSLYLLQEYYHRKHNQFMRSSTLKALAIHTASEAGNDPGPDYVHGWGLLNAVKAATVITSMNTDHLIQERTLNNGGTYSFQVVASGKEPLVATMAWTDPEAPVISTDRLNNRTPKLINDLDIRISRGTDNFLPWRLSFSSPSSPATKGDNTVDNVEKIEIPNAIPGETYTITVSHKGALTNNTQAFGLIVSGVNGTGYCSSSSAGSAGPSLQQLSVGGSFVHTPTAGTCVSYLSFFNNAISLQANSAVPFTASLTECSGPSTGKAARIFIDYNNDGDFDDANESVATSNVITGNGDFTGTINVPSAVAVGSTLRMRLVIQETANPAGIQPCGSYARGGTYDYLVRIAQPSTDIFFTGLAYPSVATCANNAERIGLRIRNNSSTTTVQNIPVTITVKDGATAVATHTGTFLGRIAAGAEVIYNAQFTFPSLAGKNYTVEVTTSFSDQNPNNNSSSYQFSTLAAGSIPNGTATICGTQAQLRSTNTDGTTFWYTAPTGGNPIATGANINTNNIPPNNTYHVGRNDLVQVPVGSITSIGGSQGYSWFRGIFHQFSNNIPVTMKTVRIFSATSGKAEIILGDLNGTFTPGSSYSYFPFASTTIDVMQSRNATTGQDTGFIYTLNLPVSQTGNHIMIMSLQAVPGGDTLFAAINNGITNNPYPIGNANFQITGNNNYTTAAPNRFQQFFYLTYNLEIQGGIGCPSPGRNTVVATVEPAITAAQNGNILSIQNPPANSTYQWYRNEVPVVGGNGPTLTIIEPGNYRADVSGNNCTRSSNTINATVTALIDLDNPQVGALIAPNPNNGSFEIAFQTNQTGLLQIELFTVQGQRLFSDSRPGFTGTYQRNMNLNLANGVYWVKVKHGNRSWSQKMLIKK